MCQSFVSLGFHLGPIYCVSTSSKHEIFKTWNIFFKGVAVSLLLCFTNSEVLLLLRTRLTKFMDNSNINLAHLTLGNNRTPWVSLGQLDPHYHGQYQHNFDRTKNRNPESVWVFSSTSSPSLPPWYNWIQHYIFGWNQSCKVDFVQILLFWYEIKTTPYLVLYRINYPSWKSSSG